MACKPGCVCGCQEMGCCCAVIALGPVVVLGVVSMKCSLCARKTEAVVVQTAGGARVTALQCPRCDISKEKR